MKRTALARLVVGFRRFHRRYFETQTATYRRLARGGQSPRTLVIGCSDSRVDPAIISSAGPGELFIVRNVANLVPPYEIGGGLHGTSAALEFAVCSLMVENIIILGHRQCGGIRALVTDRVVRHEDSFITRWMSVSADALTRARAAAPDAGIDELSHRCELESIKTSVGNLMTFPFVAAAVRERGLELIGAYFDLESGRMLALDARAGEFRPVNLGRQPALSSRPS